MLPAICTSQISVKITIKKIITINIITMGKNVISSNAINMAIKSLIFSFLPALFILLLTADQGYPAIRRQVY